MANKYLAREDAPFGSDVWDRLDKAMVKAARGRLTGRRLLDIDGPFGLGLKAVPLRDTELESGLIASEVLPLYTLYEDFTLGVRDLAAYERDKIGLNVGPVVQAAIKCAQREDDLIFNGTAGIPGLMTAEGVNEVELSDWDEVGTAGNDLIKAVTKLDAAGFHGPYALALAPERYNLLFRLYEQNTRSEMEHIKTIVTDGIFKAPILEEGGVLISTDRYHASIVLGQDMTVGFIGPVGDRVEFFISESLTLRIRRPQAICVLV
ncbi:MAG: family 1 encapsulin nanocompartment shell protein [Anaerolineae bacterium]